LKSTEFRVKEYYESPKGADLAMASKGLRSEEWGDKPPSHNAPGWNRNRIEGTSNKTWRGTARSPVPVPEHAFYWLRSRPLPPGESSIISNDAVTPLGVYFPLNKVVRFSPSSHSLSFGSRSDHAGRHRRDRDALLALQRKSLVTRQLKGRLSRPMFRLCPSLRSTHYEYALWNDSDS